MQTELIETFLDLVETHSFNRTAERLGVTQSTVSGRVAALEKQIDRKLFSRSRAGTEMTTAGLAFEPHARGLRHAWTEALRATQHTGILALSMRIGLQIDLAASHIGDWVAEFRELLPEASFYLELDYSIQMCADLASGKLDMAVIYTPRTWPDLHLESVGEVRYRLVSSEGAKRTDIDPHRHIRGDFSPSFEHQRGRLYPEFNEAQLATGQNAAIVGILTAIGGSAFVLESTADELVASANFHLVQDAPAIQQTVYTAIHLRHRHARVYRRLSSIVRSHFRG